MRIAALLLSLGIALVGVYAAGSLALLAEGAWARLTLGLMASACLAIGLGGLMAVAGQRRFRLPTLLSCSSLPLLWLLACWERGVLNAVDVLALIAVSAIAWSLWRLHRLIGIRTG